MGSFLQPAHSSEQSTNIEKEEEDERSEVWGAPLGADGYGRQQAGVQGGQTLAAALPAPLPADGHGGRGDSREGSLTSCNQHIAD